MKKPQMIRFVKNLMFCLFLYLSPSVYAQQDFVVKPYLQFSTKTSIRIMWETRLPATSVVEYGLTVKGAATPKFTEKVSLDGLRQMHEVELTGLKEEANYVWRTVAVTANAERLESEVYTFKTAVADEGAYMFAMLGDAQRNNKTPWAWGQISKQVWGERPNFVVLAGDLVDWGHNKNEWINEFLGPGHQLMSRIPVFSVLGNHEGDADYYYQYMANPQPEYCYTFKYGNAEFFMVDTNRDLRVGSDQYNWLEQQLAKSTATWKIAVHHHPPYSSESDDHGETFKGGLSTLGHRQARDLPSLFDKYGVDFSLFGHTHVYERTWPLKDNRINQREGTIYINSGGAGGGLETFAPTRNWFTLEVQEGHHYCTFAIYDKTLVFKAINDKGQMFDSFQLNKATDRDEVVVTIPPAPMIQSEKYVFHNKTEVTIDPGLDNLTVRYTLDGTEPTSQSPAYHAPFAIETDVEVKARAFNRAGQAGRVSAKHFSKMTPLAPVKTKKSARGLVYKLYTGDWRGRKDTYLNSDQLATEGVLPLLDIEHINPAGEYWAIDIEGFLEVPQTGTYTFYGIGSRGLSVRIDDMDLINSLNEKQKTVQITLEKGKHRIKVVSFQRSWRKALGFGFYDNQTGRIPFRIFDLSH